MCTILSLYGYKCFVTEFNSVFYLQDYLSSPLHLKREFNLGEKHYLLVALRARSRVKKWDDLETLLTTKVHIIPEIYWLSIYLDCSCNMLIESFFANPIGKRIIIKSTSSDYWLSVLFTCFMPDIEGSLGVKIWS